MGAADSRLESANRPGRTHQVVRENSDPVPAAEADVVMKAQTGSADPEPSPKAPAGAPSPDPSEHDQEDPDELDDEESDDASVEAEAEAQENAPRTSRGPRPESPARRARRLKRARQRVRRRIRAALLILAGLVLLAGAWVGYRTYQAYNELRESAALVSTLQTQIAETDRRAASTTLVQLQEHTEKASSAAHDPVVRLASLLPWVGTNLDAVAEIADTTDELADTVLPKLVNIVEVLNPADFAPRNGVVDVSGLVDAGTDLDETRLLVDAARQRMAAIDRDAVTEPVATATLRLWAELDDISELTTTGSRLASLLPAMLGNDGPRTYLLVSQNLAEPRSTGGLFGSFAVLNTDKGLISMGESGSVSRKIGVADPPLTGLPSQLTDLYSGRIASYAVDANFTPDFPTAADIFARMYTQKTGEPVDGVIAVDPKALSYVLAATGSVDVPTDVEAGSSGKKFITLNSGNAVKLLLSDIYRIFDDDDDAVARDEFLAQATAAVFERVMNGGGDPTKLLDGLIRSGSEGRLLIWSADAAEQELVADTALAGRLPADDGADPVFGVYFNDGTGAKLGYYLRSTAQLTPGTCRADGRQEWTLKVSMSYSAPSTGLPEYVLGLAGGGEPYVLRTNVLAVGPSAGGISGVDRDGASTWMQAGQESGRAAGVVTVDLQPGQTTDLTFQMYTDAVVGAAAGTQLSPQVRMTPGIGKSEISVTGTPICQPAT